MKAGPARWLGALAALCAFGASAAPARPSCSLGRAPVVLLAEGDPNEPDGRLLQRWDLRNTPALWATSATTPGFERYLGQVRKLGIDTDPVRGLVANPGANNDLVRASASPWIGPANCFERLLVGMQNDRVGFERAPTEFVSVVLRRSATDALRVYFYTVNRNGIGAMTPITRLLDADLREGWALWFVLHNHAFHATAPSLNGIVAPSIPDAHFQYNLARSHGLREARITNGLHTVRIPAAHFAEFQRE